MVEIFFFGGMSLLFFLGIRGYDIATKLKKTASLNQSTMSLVYLFNNESFKNIEGSILELKDPSSIRHYKKGVNNSRLMFLTVVVIAVVTFFFE